MSRTCWDWCTQKHEHNYSSVGVNGVRREFMLQKERDEIFLKTGKRVEDRADWRRLQKETGLRDAEKGEFCYDMMDALKVAGETGTQVDPRYALDKLDLNGNKAREDEAARRWSDPNYVRQRYLQNCQKLGVEPQD